MTRAIAGAMTGAMGRAAALAAGLATIWAVWALALAAPGEVRMDLYEGDAIHLAALVLRMAGGEVPSVDFMTPLGPGAAGPVALFVAAGRSVADAFVAAQIAVAAALLPALWWIGVSRLRAGWPAWALGALVLSLVMALVHGEAQGALSVSMHYNRWGWGAAFVALALALLPPGRERPAIDGVVAGLALSALALTKVTYLVAFLPAVVVAFAARGAWRTLGWGAGTGLLAAVAVTVWAGPAWWLAHAADLLTVAGSESRATPGLPLRRVLVGPAYLGGTAVLLAGIVLLRRAGLRAEGLALLVALPGFVLVTWQNFGNDPQWLPFVGLVLLALAPGGAAAGRGLAMAGGAAIVLGLPSVLNTGASVFRHAVKPAEGHVPLLALPGHEDLRVVAARARSVEGRAMVPGFDAAEGSTPARLNGADLRRCHLSIGATPYLTAVADAVNAAGAAGRPVLVADLYADLWLFGAQVPPLPGGAPWHYAGLPGVEAAEVLVVPTCPVAPRARREVLAGLDAAGTTLREIGREKAAIVLRIDRPEDG